MPQKHGRKRATPRRAYAEKAHGHANSQFGTNPPGKARIASANPVFSMFDAARNTEGHGSWADKKLRNTRIKFVEASSLETSFQNALNFHTEAEQLPSTSLMKDNGERKMTGVGGPRIEESLSPSETMTAKLDFVSSVDELQGKMGLLDESPRLDSNAPNTTSGADPSHQSSSLSSNEREVKGAEEGEDVPDSDDEVLVFMGRKSKQASRRLDAEDALSVQAVEKTIPDALVPKQDSARQHKSESLALPPSSQEVAQHDLALEDYFLNIGAISPSDEELDFESQQQEPLDSQVEIDDVSDLSGQDVQNTENSSNEHTASGYEGDLANLTPGEPILDQATLAMKDEELARKLAKQEELGLGSSEILLWDGQDLETFSDEDQSIHEGKFEVKFLRNAARELARTGRQTVRNTNQFTLPRVFSDLDLGGDDYGDFDIMDFSRPSLQPKTRASKRIPFEISDSELEINMQRTWENDRQRKKLRKQEREQSQMQRNLGTGENAEMSVRYSSGITVQELKVEIKSFLMSEQQTLPLLPLDKSARKAIHAVANRLNLQSKSKGDGIRRYPCLYKTLRTSTSNLTLVDSAFARSGLNNMSRRLVMPSKSSQRGTASLSNRNVRGYGASGGVSYKDGETVGATAPALGSENRGHILLSKMGWALGTGLGPSNNKGSLEPVAHIVKSTRAGLG